MHTGDDALLVGAVVGVEDGWWSVEEEPEEAAAAVLGPAA